MQVLVVSGFLGAGKTTFITAMAQRCRQKFVVMENEMGAVGVDGGLLTASLGDDVDIWELTEGCICCSMKADFAASVLTIENSLEPEYLLVEPTGVGMLSRIMDNLSQIAYERIQLLRPITIVDALNARISARDFPDIFADQVASAGTVVFSKAEGISNDERGALEALVRRHAPTAELISHPYTSQATAWWNGLWCKALDGTILREPAETVNPGLSMDTLRGARIPSLSAMAVFLEQLLRGAYGGIVRAKGTVALGEEWLRFDVAGGQYCLTGAEPGMENISNAVFIGQNIKSQALRTVLATEGTSQAFKESACDDSVRSC